MRRFKQMNNSEESDNDSDSSRGSVQSVRMAISNPNIVGRLDPYDVNSPWDSYAERVEFFFTANNITDENKKKAILLTSIGDKTYETIRALAAPETPKDLSYADIVSKLKEHLNPAPNEIIQRFHFRKRVQGEGETIAAFVADLRRLSEHCKFTELENMIRDQIVCGVRDEALQKRLFVESKLDMKKALEMAIAAEAAVKNVQDVRAPLDSAIHKVGKGNYHYNKSSQGKPTGKHPNVNRSWTKPCFRCTAPHDPANCGFKTAVCNYCKQRGHIVRACLKRNGNNRAVHQVPEQCAEGQSEDGDNWYGLNTMTVKSIGVNSNRNNSGGQKKFTAKVKVNGHPIEMEVDTGAAVTVIAEHTWMDIGAPTLKHCDIRLQTWSKHQLQLLGQCQVTVEHRNNMHKLVLFVIQGHGTSLLGRNWFAALGINVAGIHTVNRESEDFKQLLRTYSDVFSEELGAQVGRKISIELKPEAKPIFLRFRQVEFALRPLVEKEIDSLVGQGIYEPVEYSDWATPLVPVRKKDGSIRLCGDYRSTVNKVIKNNTYPLPTINEVLAIHNGAVCFAKLDLKQAYQQLVLDDESAEMLTVNTHKGLYRVRRLPFGVSAAAGLFQRVIENVVRGIPGTIAYLDDIFISAKNHTELYDRLVAVLDRLRRNKLTVRKEKCTFPCNKIDCLGFVLDSNGIRPDEKKVEAIRKAPEPKDKTELQSFLGMINFYNRFLINKATVAESLHRLLDQDKEWEWTQEHSNAFNALKKLLQTESVLTYFDEEKQLVLACDASPYGVGAVLSHREKGFERPIAFTSKTLGKSERNYGQFDKEALAIIFGVKHFHQYIANRPVTIITDHKPLLGIFDTRKTIPLVISPRMKRWCLMLSTYDYQLEYRPGKEHGNADGLSRLPMPSNNDETVPPGDIHLLEGLKNPPIQAENISNGTKKDLVIGTIYQYVVHGWPTHKLEGEHRHFNDKKLELSTHKGCLLWGNRVVIPSSLRREVMLLLHANHPGITAMKAIARSFVWWPNLDKEIELCVQACNACQIHRNNPPKAPIQKMEGPINPWSTLHLDFAGPFRGKVFLVVVDAMSKWVEVKIMSNQTSSETIRALRNMFATHGIPDRIITDNGRTFVSNEFRQFLWSNGIKFATSAPYHPSSNGQAERMVGYTKQVLSTLQEGDLGLQLARFLFRQHTTPHSTTGKTPAELLMGRALRTALHKLHPSNIQREDKPEGNIMQENTRCFSVADTVYIRGYAVNGPKWEPAKIIAVNGPVSYTTELEDGRIMKRHVDQIRKRVADDFFSSPSSSSANDNGGTETLAHDNNEPGETNVPGARTEEATSVASGARAQPDEFPSYIMTRRRIHVRTEPPKTARQTQS